MSNSINVTKRIRRISTIALLLLVLMQIITVILLETGFSKFEIEELHEICGFTIFGLVLLHGVFFRKSLKNLISFKTQ